MTKGHFCAMIYVVRLIFNLKNMSRAERHEIEEVKREMNKETSEGGVTVRIGTREEIDLANKAAENEGKVETLAEYIKLNKEVVATAEELEQSLAQNYLGLYKEFVKNPVGSWLFDGANVYFKDKAGNLAVFRLAYNDRCKISEFAPILRNGDGRDVANFVSEKMAATGFEKTGSHLFGQGAGSEPSKVFMLVRELRHRKSLEQGKKEFDF